MKHFVLLSLVLCVRGDHGYGPAVDHPRTEAPIVYSAPRQEYAAPVVPIRTPPVPIYAAQPTYAAPTTAAPRVVTAPPRVEYVAPRVEYRAPVTTRPKIVIPKISVVPLPKAPLAPVPIAPVPTTTTAAPRLEVEYSAPAKVESVYTAPLDTGYEYAPQAKVYRTEQVLSPSTEIAYDFAWTAPAYQKIVAETGYAPITGYTAPVRSDSEGYAAASEYSAPATYGAPLTRAVEESVVEGARYAPVAGTEARAYIRLHQSVGGSVGTRTLDAEGNVVDETYSSDAEPNFKFAYGVEDPLSGDIKNAEEERHGSDSRGSYSLLQPDGCTRTVRYMTDEWGFKAMVEYRGPGCAERYDL